MWVRTIIGIVLTFVVFLVLILIGSRMLVVMFGVALCLVFIFGIILRLSCLAMVAATIPRTAVRETESILKARFYEAIKYVFSTLIFGASAVYGAVVSIDFSIFTAGNPSLDEYRERILIYVSFPFGFSLVFISIWIIVLVRRDIKRVDDQIVIECCRGWADRIANRLSSKMPFVISECGRQKINNLMIEAMK